MLFPPHFGSVHHNAKDQLSPIYNDSELIQSKSHKIITSRHSMSIEKVRLLYIEIFGLLGEALTTFDYVPQLLRILKLKSAREISLPFTLSFLAGAICWLTYGILLSLVSIILSNSAGIIFLDMLLYGKLKYGR
jgi:MtN3 and saliva related transmembrane protein